MSKFELANEGVTPRGAMEYFRKYNDLLQTDAKLLVTTLGRLASGEALDSEHEASAEVISNILDTTNNGTQIGLGSNTELSWDYVFRDKGHKDARHAYADFRPTVEQLRYDIAIIEKEINRKAPNDDKHTAERLREKQAELKVAEEKLAELCRKRGYQTLKVVASLNTIGSGPTPRSTHQLAA